MFCRLPLRAVTVLPRTHGQMCISSPWPQRIERYINLHDKDCPSVSYVLGLYRKVNEINQLHIHMVDVSRNHC
jgi:hypothetical protein